MEPALTSAIVLVMIWEHGLAKIGGGAGAMRVRIECKKGVPLWVFLT